MTHRDVGLFPKQTSKHLDAISDAIFWNYRLTVPSQLSKFLQVSSWLLSLDFCRTTGLYDLNPISHIISPKKNRQVCNGAFGPCTPTIFLVENASQLALVSLVAVKGTGIPPSSLEGADLVQSQERQEFFSCSFLPQPWFFILKFC